MKTYLVTVSNFDSPNLSFDISWINRKFRWEDPEQIQSEFHSYLSALADNTKKSPVICMSLAAKYMWPDASVQISCL